MTKLTVTDSSPIQQKSHRVTPRSLRIVEWAVIALLAAQFAVRTLPEAWKTLNTDFPNYFLTASLVHERFDTSRVYEWVWIERQKQHRQLDQRIVGMVPITPFSTLAVYPLTSMPALTAKHYWTVFNLGLLAITIILLRNMTGIGWRRILLVVALNFALRLNFMYGQYYVLLLFLLTLACFLYLRQRRFLAGVLIGIAVGLKVFPVIFLLYFVRKRDWRAFAGGAISGVCAAAVSIAVFGWELHRTYLAQVLPAVLRGEGLDPFNLQAASLSTLLHRLFVYEPQLNLHPAVHAAYLFAVFHPLLQMVVTAPGLLLAAPGESSPRRVRLEWAAILVASLAISTSPGSYLFTLLILPVCLMLEALPEKRQYLWTLLLLLTYTAAAFFEGASHGFEGWSAILGAPRLHALLALCIFAVVLLAKVPGAEAQRWPRWAWAGALGIVAAVSIWSNLRHQRGLYDDYQWRVVAPKDAYMTVHPTVQGDALLFVSMLGDGYHSGAQTQGGISYSKSSADDQLAVTASGSERWVELAGSESNVVSSDLSTDPRRGAIREAESPVSSADGKRLAYLRVEHGRGWVWLRALDDPTQADVPVTPPEMNVTEMSLLPQGGLVFAAVSDGRHGLFVAGANGEIRSLGAKDARYPAMSPDGRWLAYSQLEDGNWHLWLRDMAAGSAQRLSQAQCNNTEPAWAADSKTLYYASDCGRGLWFSVICKRRVTP